MSTLNDFVAESNRIEGLTYGSRDYEIEAHETFLGLPAVTVPALELFVTDVAARPLRRKIGQDVRVGYYFPPPGGPHIERELKRIVKDANEGNGTPYSLHVAYEQLHPFLDGNGRSGRVLWAWMMLRDGLDPFALPFLHRWYYQSLDASR